MLNLGHGFWNLRQYSVARAKLKEALQLSQGAGGEGHWRSHFSLNQLAGIYNALGDTMKAERMLLKMTCDLECHPPGEQNPDPDIQLARKHLHLGRICRRTRRHSHADAHLRRAWRLLVIIALKLLDIIMICSAKTFAGTSTSPVGEGQCRQTSWLGPCRIFLLPARCSTMIPNHQCISQCHS